MCSMPYNEDKFIFQVKMEEVKERVGKMTQNYEKMEKESKNKNVNSSSKDKHGSVNDGNMSNSHSIYYQSSSSKEK